MTAPGSSGRGDRGRGGPRQAAVRRDVPSPVGHSGAMLALSFELVCAALNAQTGELVIDLCAGAGGKTLALAASMDNRGRLIATDTDRTRLSRLEPRAWRAGVTIAETRLLNPNREAEALADLVEFFIPPTKS